MNEASARSWKLERDAEGIAWLTLDKPGTSANVLSGGVLMELDELLGALERDPPRGAVLVSAKKSGFVAGADIKEFTGLSDEASGYQLIRSGQQVLNRLAALRFPKARVDAVELSKGAIEVARKNVTDHRLKKRVRLWRGDLFAPVKAARYDLIISNPPYVDAEGMAALPRECRAESRNGASALSPGKRPSARASRL